MPYSYDHIYSASRIFSYWYMIAGTMIKTYRLRSQRLGPLF